MLNNNNKLLWSMRMLKYSMITVLIIMTLNVGILLSKSYYYNNDPVFLVTIPYDGYLIINYDTYQYTIIRTFSQKEYEQASLLIFNHIHFYQLIQQGKKLNEDIEKAKKLNLKGSELALILDELNQRFNVLKDDVIQTHKEYKRIIQEIRSENDDFYDKFDYNKDIML